MSWMLAAPPGTAASMRRSCASSSVTSGSICGVSRVQPSGIALSGTTGAGRGEAPASSVARAKSAKRGFWNSVRTCAPKPCRRSRSSSCMASSEWPPSSKKLSLRPTRGAPSTSAHTAAIASSAAPCGASQVSAAAANTGSGSAARSTLPLAFNGSAASTVIADGTMYSGSTCASPSRSVKASTGRCASRLDT
ncbi:hypothetical protein D3C72_972470 [compost metagenome]